MQLENDFTVPAPIDEAWAVLLDVERVAPCLPGATVEPGDDEGEYNGTMTVKIGPITARYKGTVKIQEADEAARRAVMRAQAKDARGQGTAAATITSTMEESAEGTKVKVVTDMRVTGPAAQFGRGVMQDVSAKMMRQFAECLASEMSGPSDTWSSAGEEAAAPEPAQADGGREVGASAGTQEPTGGAGVTSGSGSVGRPEATPPPLRPRPTPEALDLADVSREAVLKRAAPAVGAMLVLFLLWRLIRR
jgi:carbon monoxide dehydrogenase subunit G